MKVKFDTISESVEVNRIENIVKNMLIIENDNDLFYCDYIKKDFLYNRNYIAYPVFNSNLLLNNLFIKLKIDKMYLTSISKELFPINKNKYLELHFDNNLTHFVDGHIYVIDTNSFHLSKVMFWSQNSYFMFSSLDFKLNIVYSVEEEYGIVFFKNTFIIDNFLSILRRELELIIDKMSFYDLPDDKNYIIFFTKLKNYYESILKEQGYLK